MENRVLKLTPYTGEESDQLDVRMWQTFKNGRLAYTKDGFLIPHHMIPRFIQELQKMYSIISSAESKNSVVSMRS